MFLKDGKILFCKQKTENYYFLPGGHVEFGELTSDCVSREIKEELGAGVSEISFIGAVENIFSDEEGKHHELNLVFSAKLDRDDVESLEDHLEFAWINSGELKDQNILPLSLKKSLIKWLDDGKIFWAREKN